MFLFLLWLPYLQNAWLDEAPIGIKIVKRNTNNLRYADDTNLIAESEEELKSLLMRIKEQESSNFMTAVTVCRDFGAQEHKICHCFFHFPPSI